MPYACAVKGGRVVLEPAPDQSYDIAGRREQQPHTVCSRLNPSRCRTWMLHRFDLECSGERVPWVSVVAAAPTEPRRRLWLENGRLHVQHEPARRLAAAPRSAAVALPTGFAPLVQLGARIVQAPLPPLRGPHIATRDARTSSETAVSSTGVSTAQDETVHTVDWQTRTLPESAESTDEADAWAELGASFTRRAPAAAMAAAILLALMTAAFVWRRRLRPPVAVRETYRPDQGADVPTQAGVEDLMRSADDFYVHVVQMARSMQGAAALQDVIADELAAVDAMLRAPELAQAFAAQDWAALRQCALRVLTDLERIRRIVQSANEAAAAAAVPAAPPPEPHAVPVTRQDALAVLGVNEEASEKVIKKIVDAMRQTWHPDLARNDIDRRQREERMKQINIAWDMLRSRQQAA